MEWQRWFGHPDQDTMAREEMAAGEHLLETATHYEIADGEYLREAALATDEMIHEIDRHSGQHLWPKSPV